MRIWKVTCYDPDSGALLSWHATEAAANRHLFQFQQERGEPAIGPEGVELVVIPARKHELIQWLNSNLTSDNG